MNGKHTPGPWTAKEKSYSGPKTSTITFSFQGPDGEHQWVGTMEVGDFDPRKEASEIATARANAALIAAAPEMLDALEALMAERELAQVGGSRYWSPGNSDGWRKAQEAIEMAIGKARRLA